MAGRFRRRHRNVDSLWSGTPYEVIAHFLFLQIAFVTRCVRRVQPLYFSSTKAKNEEPFDAAVDRAIQAAERIAFTFASDANAIHDANRAVYDIQMHLQVGFGSRSFGSAAVAAAHAAGLAAHSATLAADVAHFAANVPFDRYATKTVEALEAFFTYADDAADAAEDAANDTGDANYISAYESAVSVDEQILHIVSEQHRQIRFGFPYPVVFGPLWPDGEPPLPDRFRRKQQQETEKSSDHTKFRLTFDDDVSVKDVFAFLSFINERALEKGGSGVRMLPPVEAR